MQGGVLVAHTVGSGASAHGGGGAPCMQACRAGGMQEGAGGS